jgi:hypothetical protein
MGSAADAQANISALTTKMSQRLEDRIKELCVKATSTRFSRIQRSS